MSESRGSKVNLDVAQGVLVGLIGSNGAGKTTALDAVTGFVPATGSARFEGHEVLGMRAHHRSRLGMVRTWQAVQLFEDMTVRENLLVAAEAPGAIELLTGAIKRNSGRASHARVEQVAGEFDLSDALDRKPSELSLGQRKLVGLARGIVAGPTLLLADEPASSYAGWSTMACPWSSSTTTWDWCSACATTSTCSITGSSSRRGRRARCARMHR